MHGVDGVDVRKPGEQEKAQRLDNATILLRAHVAIHALALQLKY